MNRLYRYTKFVLAATFLLIAAGGLVTSTGSGLSVPDWPLSYGKIFPPMIGGIRFEHTHRVIAGLVGILTLILMFALLKTEKRVWVRWWGGVALLAVVVQAVLGGLTVIYLLPLPVSVAHACLGQIFFSVLAALVLFLSPEWNRSQKVGVAEVGPVHRILVSITFLVYLQLILGAWVRHSPGRGVSYHVVIAFLIFMHILFSLFRILKNPGLKTLQNHIASLTVLATLQIFLGAGTYFIKYASRNGPAILIATAHQATGALILALSLTLTLRSFRFFVEESRG